MMSRLDDSQSPYALVHARATVGKLKNSFWEEPFLYGRACAGGDFSCIFFVFSQKMSFSERGAKKPRFALSCSEFRHPLAHAPLKDLLVNRMKPHIVQTRN